MYGKEYFKFIKKQEFFTMLNYITKFYNQYSEK